MVYKCEWCQEKNKDWKMISISQDGGQIIEDVSVNRNDKQGRLFPNFDAIAPGASVEGEFWQSPSTGKKYLYPPKPASGGHSGGSQGYPKANIAKLQETKRENIKEAMDNKEKGIKLASTLRMAVDMAVAAYDKDMMSVDKMKEMIISNRQWLAQHWDDQSVPFN